MQLEKLLENLPEHLRERVRRITPVQREAFRLISSETPPRDWSELQPGSFVLYWTHHALRADENPSLEVASNIAQAFDLPLLVYQGISESYRYASDRHHQFMLEGACSLQSQYRDLGIAFAFHLEREGCRGPMLSHLANKAAVVVTDDFPLEPITAWLDRLARVSSIPLVVVDSSCVVPSRLVGKAYYRAFEYSGATSKMYQARVGIPWPEQTFKAKPYCGPLPFESLQLEPSQFAALLSQCNIDHSIGPVGDTRGGSEEGYRRWNRFLEKGISSYAKKRNDAAIDGVSRMSAYLHLGMASPMRLAREAHERNAEKFLEELLVWRELAFAFCHYHPELETLDAIPTWARQSLESHLHDERGFLPSWETMARAKTGDPLWDAAQTSLLRHGELHNNVRMTWGKQILAWSKDPMTALQRLIDLNHRYALDGRDPASYGGLLWCLGQFDRPFEPELPILGTVRPRDTSDHANRLDLSKFAIRTNRPIYRRQPRIAVVGAGLGGLMAARVLSDHGLNVVVFDKSKGKGGRASTRRVTPSMQFDHGAQYFTIRDPRLMKYVTSWIDDDVVAVWEGKVAEIRDNKLIEEKKPMIRYVAVPGMSSLGAHLGRDLNIVGSTKIASLYGKCGDYGLVDDSGKEHGPFDVVLWNAPPEQTLQALNVRCEWKEQLSSIVMTRCWALMISFANRWKVPFDGAFVNQGGLRWIARNSSKPKRPDLHDSWVLHSNSDWANKYWNEDREQIKEMMLSELSMLSEIPLPDPIYCDAHRWRYAAPVESLKSSSLWDADQGLGACGDWCGGPRVEGALLSGQALAGHVLNWLHSLGIESPAAQLSFF